MGLYDLADQFDPCDPTVPEAARPALNTELAGLYRYELERTTTIDTREDASMDDREKR